MKRNLLLLMCLLLFVACTTSNETTKDSTVPESPTNLVAAMQKPGLANMYWKDRSTNETGFKIERKTSTGAYSVIGTTTANQTNFSDNTVTPNTRYIYRVYAYNSAGNSSSYTNEYKIDAF